MTAQRLEFTGHAGDTLAARLDLPRGPVRAAALMAHCFTCSKDLIAARRIAGKLASFGIATVRFDFTGLGHSGGEFANTTFSSNVADLVLAARQMADQGLAPQLLIGHSLGGAAAIKAAPEMADLKAVVTLGTPAEPAHVIEAFGARVADIRAHGRAEVSLAGRTFEIGRAFLDDIESAALADALDRFGRRALLVMHAPRDMVVGIDHAARIFTAARHPKSFISLDDADHLISRPADAEYAAEVILSWARRYLDLAPQPAPAAAPEGVVRSVEADPDGFRQDLSLDGRHHLVADEPADMGGTATGPSPYQLLSAGLAACTAMTMRMYARRKKLALAHVHVDVTHNKRHADACRDCPEGGGPVDVFRRILHIDGDLSDDQRRSLIAIADKCPVHRTLSRVAEIETVTDGE